MTTLYQFSAYHGIFLSIAILFSKHGQITANRLISLAVLFFSICLIEWTSYASLIANYPHLSLISNPFLFAIAPMLWLYAISHLEQHRLASVRHLLIASVPTVLYLLISFRFYGLDGPTKLEVLQNGRLDAYFNGGEAISPLLYVTSSIFFMAMAWWQIRDKNKSRNLSEQRRKMITYVILTYLLFSLLGFMDWVLTHYFESTPINYHITLLSQTIIIQGAGYLALVNPSVWSSNTGHRKYTQSSLDQEKLDQMASRLTQLLKTEKPYLDMDLSTKDVSARLGISNHQMSQVLSQSIGSGFNDLINRHRVEAAKEMIQSENGESYKLIHIAFDSGFNNKTTFLRNFKKFTGQTPSEFRASIKK